MRSHLPHLAPPAALAAVLALTGGAAAQDADVARAQSLFLEGRAALEHGDYAIACARFGKSLAIVPRASTLLNLAQCEEHEGRLVSALQHWKQGIAMLPPGDDRLAVSKERAAALVPRLARLTVKLSAPAPAGARIEELDGAPVSIDEIAAGIPADPGRRTVVLTIPGRPDQRATVDLAEGRSGAVTLSEGPAAPEPPEPPVAPSGGGGLRTAGFAVLGAGAAGFVLAGVTGGILVSKRGSIQTHCPGMACDPTGTELIASTAPLDVANAVGWGVGLAGLVGGVVLVVAGRRAPATLTPTALPGGGGVWMTRQF